MQDIEFTVEDEQLYLLQTRSAKRTAAAALKAATTMVDEGLITREEAVGRIDRGAARPAAPSDDRPGRDARGGREGPERLPRRCERRHRLRLRHGRRACEGRPGHPRSLGDDAGRHPRDDRVAGNPHRARRDDVARGRRRARHGQALRRGLRGAVARRRCRHDRRAPPARGRHDHDRRGHRARVRRRGAARAAAAQRGLRDDPRPGPTNSAGSRFARTPTTPRTRRARDGFGARGHRALPDRAHVLRRPAARGAGDDPRRQRSRAGVRRSTGCCRSSRPTSRASSRRWPGCP